MGRRVDTAAMLIDAVSHINTMSPRPDVVIATGDLVNSARAPQYEHLADILVNLEVPLRLVPGNHDDREMLRSTFPDLVPDGGADQRIDYVVDEWPVRLVGLDTTIPGENGGAIVAEQISWLDQVLSAQPDRPTVIFQHHPPFVTGIGWMDAVGLIGRELEAELLASHRQVCAVLCGHIHRNIHATVGGRPASTSPSTGAQVALALGDNLYEYIDEPGAVAIHQWSAENGLVSHISHVGLPEPWLPAWAQRELDQAKRDL